MKKPRWVNITFIAALTAALSLCCVLFGSISPQEAFAPISTESLPTPSGELPVASSSPETPNVEPSPTYMSVYAPTSIIIDGNKIATLLSEQAARSVIAEAIDYLSSIDDSSYADVVVENEIEYTAALLTESSVTSDEALMLLIGSDTPLKVRATVRYSSTERIESKTIMQEYAFLGRGMRIIKTYGRDGLKLCTFEDVYVNGILKSKSMLSEEVVLDAIDTLILVGIATSSADSPDEDDGQMGPTLHGMRFIRPCAGDIIFNFGNYSGGYHMGLDFEGALGDEVYASCSGVVVSASARGGLGLMIEIDHGNGITTRYAHLDSVKVQVGDTVDMGDVIGAIGESGNCNTPHLHFELRILGFAYNPRFYIEL